ncbi:hypothetical protein LTS06_009224 [Exophiala xenobiotica]|nr:hypothetical protein LTS06_009224 [Exophiala xenobiotica]
MQKGSLQRNRKRPRDNKTKEAEPQVVYRTTVSVEDNAPTTSSPEVLADSSRDVSEEQDPALSSLDQRPATPTTDVVDEWSARRRDSQLNIHDLSFILHPSHEATTPPGKTSVATPTTGAGNSNEPLLIPRACHALGMVPQGLEQMINTYFDNMVAINLFHVPTFWEKLQNISSTSQAHALLAAMVAFSARFCTSDTDEGQQHSMSGMAGVRHPPSHFLHLAFKYIGDALRECGDEAPPLCILQALIISTHCQLSQGVRGKAWRSLGQCVRLAYELNLHLVDALHPERASGADARRWCEDEEKRRAWWAVWEMDVFASTIRRCPPAVDWSQIETLFPVEDEYWFQCQARPSCFLERDLTHRWKALRDCGNQSPKAWFIVVNSLMKEAQRITSPRGIPDLSTPDEVRRPSRVTKNRNFTMDTKRSQAREKLETLSNSVRCFVLALPPRLRFRGQYLGFDAREPGQMASLRQLHCSIYNIYVMTQLAQLMIHRYDVFGSHGRKSWPTGDAHLLKGAQLTGHTPRYNSSSGTNYGKNLAWSQYFEAADNILTIVHRSCDDHIQYINPFLSSTIWLASAVQLMHKEFGPPGTNRSLVKSKFEVLYMTYKRCVAFWDIETAMQQNLDSLEAHLEGSLPTTNQNQEPLHQCINRENTPKAAGRKAPSPHHRTDYDQIRVQPVAENGMDLGNDSSTGLLSQPCWTTDLSAVEPCTARSRNVIDDASWPQSSSSQNHSGLQTLVTEGVNAARQLQGQAALQELSLNMPKLPKAASECLTPSIPTTWMLDFMYSPQPDKQTSCSPVSTAPSAPMGPLILDSEQQLEAMPTGEIQGLSFDDYTGGGSTEFPSYIYEILSS